MSAKVSSSSIQAVWIFIYCASTRAIAAGFMMCCSIFQLWTEDIAKELIFAKKVCEQHNIEHNCRTSSAK